MDAEFRPRRRDSLLLGEFGPEPPRRPRKQAGQFVWPRDKNNSTIWSWSRLKDVVTGKGPDIWCSRRGSLGPHRPVWSNWRSSIDNPFPSQDWDNLGYLYKNGQDAPTWFFAGRPNDVRYDFKKRKYCLPDHKSWSDAKYNRHNELMYHRTALGREKVEDLWWRPFHNPFAYGMDFEDVWDGDEIPY